MSARFIVGDVFDGLASLPDGSVDLVITSPPFLALRSYLPDDHPEKAKEIGGEASPGAFVDTLLDVTEALARVLAPHGSLVLELGDTYSGSGGAGGDYSDGGLREGQQAFSGSANRAHGTDPMRGHSDDLFHAKSNGRWRSIDGQPGRGGWPADKSLSLIPELYRFALAYGFNPLTGRTTSTWRIRNVKPWMRANPPVGSLGDKERPATSYVVVATKARDRYFDLDAVRVRNDQPAHTDNRGGHRREGIAGRSDQVMNPVDGDGLRIQENAAGAPPRDWWIDVTAALTAYFASLGKSEKPSPTTATRFLRDAGCLDLGDDALLINTEGYEGAHYATFPTELVATLLKEMCPERVCRTCGEPSRRIVGDAEYLPSATYRGGSTLAGSERVAEGVNQWVGKDGASASLVRSAPTLGWTDCGHEDWRPGLILDPFVGSGTTLEVATGHGRDAIGLDLDERNADLARQRVGMFLTVEHLEAQVLA